MAIEERPLGILIAAVGIVGLLVAAFADPLGLGEGHTFGWLQLTGVIVGAVVTLLGLALAMEWMPYPSRSQTTVAQGGQNTTVVRTDTEPDERTT
jgi:hypothetical protein